MVFCHIPTDVLARHYDLLLCAQSLSSAHTQRTFLRAGAPDGSRAATKPARTWQLRSKLLGLFGLKLACSGFLSLSTLIYALILEFIANAKKLIIRFEEEKLELAINNN